MTALGITSLALVALGGALGSAPRYLTSALAIEWLGAAFPGHAGGERDRQLRDRRHGRRGCRGGARLLLVTGALGGFTTFSAFSLEATMLWDRAPALSIAYVAASIVLGGALCLAGSGRSGADLAAPDTRG